MPEAPQSPRLAAIVSADIAGYSSLVERDAALALTYVARLREIAAAEAARHDGRIFNTAGDGSSISASARCESSGKLIVGASLIETTD